MRDNKLLAFINSTILQYNRNFVGASTIMPREVFVSVINKKRVNPFVVMPFVFNSHIFTVIRLSTREVKISAKEIYHDI